MKLFNAKRLVIGILFLAQGCITPINMAYDTAKPLAKGEISMAGAYSVSDESTKLKGTRFVAHNRMLRLGVGIDGKTSMYMGYHHKGGKDFKTKELFGVLDEPFNTYDFYDIGLKFSAKKNENIAFKVMGGAYIFGNSVQAVSLYNSMIFTREFNRYVEFTAILHNMTVFSSSFNIYPGVNLNAGFSTDRSIFVIRPEVGITTEAVTAGIGMELKFGQRRAQG